MVPDCKISHLFRPVVGPMKYTAHLSFGELSKLAQIATGHGMFKRHLRHWNAMGDIQCSLCGEYLESSWNLWDMCPRLETERVKGHSDNAGNDMADLLAKKGLEEAKNCSSPDPTCQSHKDWSSRPSGH